MKLWQQVTIGVLVWFFIAVINGIRDHVREDRPFWVRPGLLLVLWVYGTISFLLMYGGLVAGQWLDARGLGLFGVIATVICTICGALGVIGGIGCSFFVPICDENEFPF